jgi:hypothetical protein
MHSPPAVGQTPSPLLRTCGHVASLLSVHHVQRGHGLHAQLRRVLDGKLLGIVHAVEVLAGQGGLGASHVAAHNEVRAACTSANTQKYVLRKLGLIVSRPLQKEREDWLPAG